MATFIVVDIKIIPKALHWSFSRILVPHLRDSTCAASSWKLSQGIDDRRSPHCGIPTLSFQCDVITSHQFPGVTQNLLTHHSAQVSWCTKTDCHLVVTLENVLFLGLDRCLALVIPHLTERIALRSRGILTSHTSVSVSPLPNLLQMYFPEVSRTWHSPSCLNEHGCKKTSKISWRSAIEEDDPTHHVLYFLWGGSTNFIWVFGSKLIRSKTQLNATLWVVDTCLFVGLLSLMIILITLSFFQKCKASHWIEKSSLRKHGRRCKIQDRCAELESYPWFLVCGPNVIFRFSNMYFLNFLGALEEECNTSIIKTQWLEMGIPSIRRPASKDLISDSVELCETDVSFLHIQSNSWEQTLCLPNLHKFPWGRFWVFKISGKVRILKHFWSVLLCNVSHLTKLLWI